MSTPAAIATRHWSALVRRAPGWVALGTAGSLLATLAGARLSGGAVSWWFAPHLAPGNNGLLYLGMALLSAGWIGLWRHAREPACTPLALLPVAALWTAPLLAGAPLFSHDVYSYLAQGTVAHLGLSPYHTAPAALGALGHARVMGAVDPFWRQATAPYGPLFLALMSGVAWAVGSHLVAGVLVVRGLTLAGLVLLWVFIPRLARALGTDPVRALWLAALSPLALLQLLAPSHNDLLMVGLLVAGVALATEGRPLPGIAVCAVAMTIKLPAALAVMFIAVAWVRGLPDARARLRAGIETAAVVVAVIAVVSAATGWGLDWVSGTLFSTPAKVKLAITPATSVAWTLSSLLHDLGAGTRFGDVESAARAVAAVAAGLIALGLLMAARRENMVRLLGVALIALALGGPAAWPWYFSWGVVLLAATARFQSSRVVPAALIAGAFVVKANGILVLPLHSAPIVLAVYLALAATGWYVWTRRRGARPQVPRPGPGAPSALARSSSG